MTFSGHEILQFQYILPVQGSIAVLELVQNILDVLRIETILDMTETREIIFSDIQLSFIKSMIDILDKSQKLNLSSLTLIKKILQENSNE